MIKPRIRRYEEKDKDLFLDLCDKIDSLCNECSGTGGSAGRLAFRSEHYSSEHHLLAFRGRRLAASSIMVEDPIHIRRSGYFARITVLVDPAFRGRGLEGRLVDMHSGDAKDTGLRGLDVFLESRDEWGVDSFAGMGFFDTGDGYLRLERDLDSLESAGIPSGFSVRKPVIPYDLEDIVRVMNVCCSTNQDHVPFTSDFISKRSYISDPRNLDGGFLLLEGDDVVGTVFSTVELCPSGSGRIGGVHALGIAPKNRGKGLARGLVLLSLDWMNENYVSRAYLYVDRNNKAACELYRGLGFNVVEDWILYRKSI